MNEQVTGGINFENTVPIGDHMVVTSRAYADAFTRYLSTQWIPVSERLPESVAPVLVTLKHANDDLEVTTAEYWADGKGDDFGWGTLADKVVAWMPLPEPYKEVDA